MKLYRLCFFRHWRKPHGWDYLFGLCRFELRLPDTIKPRRYDEAFLKNWRARQDCFVRYAALSFGLSLRSSDLALARKMRT